MTYLDDLPTAGKLIVKLLLDTCDDGSIVTLLNAVLGADHDLTGLRVAEKEDFLRRKGDHIDGDFVLKDLAVQNLQY